MKKIAIVTGCAKGIGKEISLELARDGYDIIGTYNTSFDEVKLLERKLDAIGSKFYYYKLDLLNEIEINNFCNNIKSKFNKIDLLINNAALSLDNEFDLKTSEEFIDVLKVNLVGPFLLIQKLYNLIDNGVIINISSTDGINTYTKLNVDYSSSKAGLINLTKSLSLILNNIKVYAICPNWVDTESIKDMNQDYLREEMNRIGQKKLIDPKTVAKNIVNLVNSNLKSGSIVVMEDNYDR
jgi:NAD(P)-dependent dehydrogenase (short-subunit alcohol dehydrogenase family)